MGAKVVHFCEKAIVLCLKSSSAPHFLCNNVCNRLATTFPQQSFTTLSTTETCLKLAAPTRLTSYLSQLVIILSPNSLCDNMLYGSGQPSIRLVLSCPPHACRAPTLRQLSAHLAPTGRPPCASWALCVRQAHAVGLYQKRQSAWRIGDVAVGLEQVAVCTGRALARAHKGMKPRPPSPKKVLYTPFCCYFGGRMR